jgi:Uncharacterized conserved protein (COG2071)
MRPSRMSSVVERRLLVNYRVQAEVVASLLPVPLRPQQVGGWAVAGICLIRLGRLRPRWAPGEFGLRSENAAHRIAVEWDGPQGRQTGVYIPRRDSGSVVNVMAGGRLFPGEHHHALFDVYETAHDLHLAFASADGTTRVSVDVRTAQRFQGSGLFADLEEASDFFRRGSAGFSVTRNAKRLDGVELRTNRWRVEPVEVCAVRSSFFDDPHRFPPGSAVLDCALLMRDIPATWSALEPMRVTGYTASLDRPSARNTAPIESVHCAGE